MDSTAVAERARHVIAVRDDAVADDDTVEQALVAVRQLRSWADAQEAALVAKLSESAFPEARIAAASKSSLRQAERTKQRASTLHGTPRLAEALGNGDTTAEHIDVVTRASGQLPPAERARLLERADTLTDVAEASTPAQFARRIAIESKRIQADDGIGRLQRQRRATRLSSWVDAEGMWNLRGRFDPVTGVRLAARLDAAVQASFAESVPDDCPDDPIEKQKFLAAHALAALIDGTATASRSTRPAFTVVVDADAPGQPGPVAEWSIPVEIPARVLAELADTADAHTVVVRNGIILHAPGELDLGRSTRLANRAQRRALRALYATCGIPGCTVAYDRCKLHHVVWWRHGGRTDLDNLLPLCSVHHGRVHNDNWIVTLGSHRELSVRFPDGTVRTTGPPTIRAA